MPPTTYVITFKQVPGPTLARAPATKGLKALSDEREYAKEAIGIAKVLVPLAFILASPITAWVVRNRAADDEPFLVVGFGVALGLVISGVWALGWAFQNLRMLRGKK